MTSAVAINYRIALLTDCTGAIRLAVSGDRHSAGMKGEIQMAKITGSEIKVGDVLNLWLGKVRVVALKPYTGPLAHLFPQGAQLADFDQKGGMTIDNGDFYEVASF